jgi:hypothetical protein
MADIGKSVFILLFKMKVRLRGWTISKIILLSKEEVTKAIFQMEPNTRSRWFPSRVLSNLLGHYQR